MERISREKFHPVAKLGIGSVSEAWLNYVTNRMELRRD